MTIANNQHNNNNNNNNFNNTTSNLSKYTTSSNAQNNNSNNNTTTTFSNINSASAYQFNSTFRRRPSNHKLIIYISFDFLNISKTIFSYHRGAARFISNNNNNNNNNVTNSPHYTQTRTGFVFDCEFVLPKVKTIVFLFSWSCIRCCKKEFCFEFSPFLLNFHIIQSI